MRSVTCLVLAVCSSALAAQTIPKGLDSKDASGHEPKGFTQRPGETQMRSIFLYDKSTFPWGNAAYTLTGFKLRRDTLTTRNNLYTAHRKRVRVHLSTNGSPPDAPDLLLDANHGSNRARVVGSATAGKWIDFDKRAARPSPAPFSVDVKFDRPFVVPAGHDNLVVDWRAEETSQSTVYWFADAQVDAATLNTGHVMFSTSQTCLRPVPYIKNDLAYPGTNLITSVRIFESQPTPVLALLGPRLKPAINVMGCVLHTLPIAIQLQQSETNTLLFNDFVWGRIPPGAAGIDISYQFAVWKKGHPIGGVLGLSQAREIKIGTGFSRSPSVCAVHGRFLPEKAADKKIGSSVITMAPVLKPY